MEKRGRQGMERREIPPLKKVRFERRLTQCGLMLKTGIPQSRISLIENGYYSPTPEEARRITKALNLKVGEMVFPKNEAKK
jgi:transcriptional regulator with XRE-family HTH domain